MSSIKELILMSNKYGADAEYVLAGGGNTSYKDKDFLYVKGSGTSLATIQEQGFVKMDMAKLEKMWSCDYGKDLAKAEKAVLRDMMDARALGEEDKRPSVETLLHQMMPFKLVLHVHPALVNGMTCGIDGEKIAAKLFGDSALFMRATKPGYILAKAAKEQTDAFKKRNGYFPAVIFMQNHGVFFGADTLADMDKLASGVMNTLSAFAKVKPDLSAAASEVSQEEIAATSVIIRSCYKAEMGSAVTTFVINRETLELSKNLSAAEKAVGVAFTPDHIVYCKHKPLFVAKKDTTKDQRAAVEKGFADYKKKYGFLPKIVFVEKMGMFALGADKKEAGIAAEVFLDEIKIAVYASSFGGGLFMTDEDVDFILNWEVESYRQKVALSSNAKPLKGKIAIITGAAQGYGKGIAELMAEQGCNVVIADLNYDGAAATADEIEKSCGRGCAFAVKVDVSDEESVREMVNASVINFGGADILISNAGIVRAGSLDEMDLKSFELVTKINYNAFFLCTKYVQKIMKLQHEMLPEEFYDVIQINSKSGLAGSNKNFAYAGSKFGGIGLVQSFALELTPYNIKVNAVCPGNFFDGPLWSDPEKGLFVQYLKAGKVPGAKTVDDVKAAYNAKIPLGRGCRIEDVVRAIIYIIGQEYETGQAVPVTGGQEMLK